MHSGQEILRLILKNQTAIMLALGELDISDRWRAQLAKQANETIDFMDTLSR